MLLVTVVAVAKTRVQVTGSITRSESQILEMMGDRLEHVRSSPASAPLADDAAYILRQLLVKDGHASAKVDWKIVGRDQVVLVVDEGSRSYLGEVQVTGVDSELAKKLERIYAKAAESDRAIGQIRAPFREVDVATGLGYVRQELNARGYWNAEVMECGRMSDAKTGAVNLTIHVKSGALHQIGKPNVVCDQSLTQQRVAGKVERFVGRLATTGNLNAMRLEAEEQVKALGYPHADVRMGRRLEGGQFIPEFQIALGERVKLRQVHIEGLKRTVPQRINRRMRALEGEWYDESAMNKRLRGMLATGAFSSARVETASVGDGVIDATLSFEEARAREFGLAAGFGSYQGAIVRATYGDRNMWGHLLGFSAGLELGTRGLLGEVRLTDPWLFGSDISTSARVYALIYNREGYQSFETGADDKFSIKFGKHYTIEMLAGYSVVNTNGDGLPEDALGDSSYTHPRVRFSQTVDFRDNPVLPKSGWHLENALQAGVAIGDTSTSYLLAGLSGGWYHKINNRYEVGVGGEWSMIMPSGEAGDLPIDLRLFNGGARTVRSFPERELGPTIHGYATGGDAMWNMNAELIRSITDSVKVVGFMDAGSLAGSGGNLGSADIELAVGLGLRLELPIGPVRLEYGYNLTRDANEPTGTLHFAIGCAF